MQTQTTKAATASAQAHRIVVRGTNAKGKYQRRVRVVHGTYEQACKEMNDKANELAKGLKDVFYNVFNGKKGSGYIEHN